MNPKQNIQNRFEGHLQFPSVCIYDYHYNREKNIPKLQL
jgi:hypothetical protein